MSKHRVWNPIRSSQSPSQSLAVAQRSFEGLTRAGSSILSAFNDRAKVDMLEAANVRAEELQSHKLRVGEESRLAATESNKARQAFLAALPTTGKPEDTHKAIMDGLAGGAITTDDATKLSKLFEEQDKPYGSDVFTNTNTGEKKYFPKNATIPADWVTGSGSGGKGGKGEKPPTREGVIDAWTKASNFAHATNNIPYKRSLERLGDKLKDEDFSLEALFGTLTNLEKHYSATHKPDNNSASRDTTKLLLDNSMKFSLDSVAPLSLTGNMMYDGIAKEAGLTGDDLKLYKDLFGGDVFGGDSGSLVDAMYDAGLGEGLHKAITFPYKGEAPPNGVIEDRIADLFRKHKDVLLYGHNGRNSNPGSW